jgi:uncharacterized delta-60 repeat protein
VGIWLAPILACLALGAQSSAAKPGTLDRSFGGGGRTVVAVASPVPEFPELRAGMAWAGHGRIVIAGGHTIVKYLPNGRPDRAFGERSRLTIHSPSGLRFRLQAIAVDSKGRLLIAGTSNPVPEVSSPGPRQFPGPPPAWATVTRYLPDGRRDTAFGNNGTVNSTLGLPPPKPNSGFDSSAPPFQYQTPAVEATGLAVDSQDRPVLTGTFVEQVTYCYPGVAVGWHGSYVARLTASGSMDGSFQGAGLLQIPDLAYASRPTLTPDGRIAYESQKSTQCLRGAPAGPTALNLLNADGHQDIGFGSGGSVAIEQPQPQALAVDRRGRILLAGPVLVSSEYDEEPEFRIVRISANGSADTGFGRRGSVVVPQWMSVAAIASDRRGRILLAGSANGRPSKRNRFVLARMNASGEIERNFGHGGFVKTGFGRWTFADAEEILIDPQNRIVVGGTLSGSGLAADNGLAMARYLGDR